MVSINDASMSIVQIECRSYHTDVRIGTASGFIVAFMGRRFLVTNWHVVSGRHAQTKKPLHESLALPGRLLVNLKLKRLDTNTNDGSYWPIRGIIEIEISEDESRLYNFMHPKFGSDVDVVAMPIDEKLANLENYNTKAKGLELYVDQSVPFDIKVMDEVFIAGFPELMMRPNDFPVYKAGFVASEPHIYSGVPFFFIDGKTKKGWSGSPIIFNPGKNRPLGTWSMLRKGKRVITTERILIAVYSGRDEHDTELLKSELGMAWPVDKCLLPILEAQQA